MRMTDKIRFYILKTLKDFPDIHGYTLFQMLKQYNLVKNASQLYKILRSMESNGFITSIEVESEKGPDKKNLQITEKGKENYYLEVLEHFKIVADFIGEAITKADQPRIGLEVFMKKYQGLKNKKIYIDLQDVPPMIRSGIITNALIPYSKSGNNSIYIDKFKDNPIFSTQNLLKEHLILLDESVSLKKNSIDIIISNAHKMDRKFLDKYHYLRDIIKKDGEITIALMRPPPRGRKPPGLNMNIIFKFFANELPKTFRKQFLSQVPEIISEEEDIKLFSYSEFLEIVKKDFKEIREEPQNEEFRLLFLSEKFEYY